MATIVNLVPRGNGRPAGRSAGESATIIFFTGVRYDRGLTPLPPAAPGPNGQGAATSRKAARTPR